LGVVVEVGPGPLVALVLVVLTAVVALLYNRLVRARARVDEAWANVATQLQRRHDLVPELVTTVQAYAAHERDTLEAVTDARARALAAGAPDEHAAAEDALGDALGRLLALGEAYPDLRADARFAQLQRQLAETEARIAFARGFANDRVRRYHELTGTVPTSLVARAFRFGPARSFVVEDAAARTTPPVELDH
jgi:LemA protein